MDIEIEIVGKSNKWVLNQPLIRIGRSTKCEIALPDKQYPAIALEHVALEVINDTVRLAGKNGATGDTYLNDLPASAGSVVHPGDVLRLGEGGPELRIRFQVREARSAPVGYEPTRLVRFDEEPVYEPTRVINLSGREADPTVLIPSAGSAGKKPDQATTSAPAAGSSYSPYATQTASGMSGRSAPPSTAGADSGNSRNLEGRMKLMQYVLLVNLALLVVLLFYVAQLTQQLSQTREELHELHVQAQTAVGQFTPELDAKLGVFEEHMNGMDAKLRAAGVSMQNDLDAKMKVAEERMVNRMNAEIPAMLDKYISHKLGDLKH
jgi:pSer/pThr/pTyr-binding forkhead associated (FHA) protein